MKFFVIIYVYSGEYAFAKFRMGMRRLIHPWALIYSNHNRGLNTHVCRFLERHGIPYHYLPTTRANKREEEILDLASGTDFLVLARYMQVRYHCFAAMFFYAYYKSFIEFVPSFILFKLC